MDDAQKEAFGVLKNDLIHLYRRWVLYRQLFATNPHRIDVINRTAPDVLSEFQWLVVDHMILALSAMTDPVGTGARRNLSLHYLYEQLQGSLSDEERRRLSGTLDALVASVDAFRVIRNKRLAHKDLAVAMGSAEDPLPGVSRKQISDALALAADALNQIEGKFLDGHTLYSEIIIPLTSDGRALTIWLQKGLAYEQLSDEGRVEPDYWRGLGDIDAENA